eukprot:12192716-Alexandrium_andersonii.AAC.1
MDSVELAGLVADAAEVRPAGVWIVDGAARQAHVLFGPNDEAEAAFEALGYYVVRGGPRRALAG